MRRIFPFLCLVGGIALIFWSVMEMMDAKASLKWPQTDGEIISSEVKKRVRQNANQSGVRRMLYKPEITYEFEVDGNRYESEKIAFGDSSFFTKGPAAKIQSQYPVGKAVTVNVNPARPRQSVLEPGMTSKAWILPTVGIALTGFGLVALLRPTKSRKKAA
ncbi:MAG: DUF3592 domain-containing protein [Verrucomicrobiales bacterium]|nr:DUF3592 domain-containing protein [Verrucomicrobiales bacterium]